MEQVITLDPIRVNATVASIKYGSLPEGVVINNGNNTINNLPENRYHVGPTPLRLPLPANDAVSINNTGQMMTTQTNYVPLGQNNYWSPNGSQVWSNQTSKITTIANGYQPLNTLSY